MAFSALAILSVECLSQQAGVIDEEGTRWGCGLKDIIGVSTVNASCSLSIDKAAFWLKKF